MALVSEVSENCYVVVVVFVVVVGGVFRRFLCYIWYIFLYSLLVYSRVYIIFLYLWFGFSRSSFNYMLMKLLKLEE